jgi:hypothetical protein
MTVSAPDAPPASLGNSPAASSAAPEADAADRLRRALQPLLTELAGSPPRPVRLVRGLGLDKSLASRLVQAAQAPDDAEFLHRLPSPTGLRMLAERSRGVAEAAAWLPDFEQAVERFDRLLAALPGGRQALDARLGAASPAIRGRREHMARQASFKAVSFLFGHYCELLSTSLILFPSADGQRVDAIEVHRRLGLGRITPGTPLPLLSLHTPPDPSVPGPAGGVTPVDGGPSGAGSADDARRYFIPEGCSGPLPPLEVEHEGHANTFLLGPLAAALPQRLTTAVRMGGVQPLRPTEAVSVRSYMLHTPCHRLVREIYLADGLWPDAALDVGFYLPGPTGSMLRVPTPGKPHYRRLQLNAPIEVLPTGPAPLAEVPDHQAVLAAVLRRAGLNGLRLRGWRCEMPYPVPLVEMQLGFSFA